MAVLKSARNVVSAACCKEGFTGCPFWLCSKWAIRPLVPTRGAGVSSPLLSAEHMIACDSNRPNETNKRHPDRHQQYLVAHDELLGRSEGVLKIPSWRYTNSALRVVETVNIDARSNWKNALIIFILPRMRIVVHPSSRSSILNCSIRAGLQRLVVPTFERSQSYFRLAWEGSSPSAAADPSLQLAIYSAAAEEIEVVRGEYYGLTLRGNR